MVQANARLSAVVIGTLVCLIMQLILTLLGAAIGLSVRPEPGQGLAIGTGIYAAVSLGISVFLGAWVASRLAGWQSRLTAGVHGFAAFALFCLVNIFWIGNQASSLLGTAIAQAGVGAGAASGTDQLMEELGKVRIVTDMSIMKGKAVTRIVPPKEPSERVAGEAKEKAESLTESPEIKAEIKEAAGDARDVAVKASWGGFAGLLLGGILGFLGGLLGRASEPLPPTAERRERPHRAA